MSDGGIRFSVFTKPWKTRPLEELGRFVHELGVRVFSVAGPTDEATIAACAESGVPTIRVMVAIGVQNHDGGFVCNAMGLRHLIAGYDPRRIQAV